MPPATIQVLRSLEESLMHERRAQQELVYVVSARVLDAVQWCAVAAALHPLHCDLEPLLCAIAQLPETQPAPAVSAQNANARRRISSTGLSSVQCEGGVAA